MVLPTPPFWFAMAITRGSSRAAGFAPLSSSSASSLMVGARMVGSSPPGGTGIFAFLSAFCFLAISASGSRFLGRTATEITSSVRAALGGLPAARLRARTRPSGPVLGHFQEGTAHRRPPGWPEAERVWDGLLFYRGRRGDRCRRRGSGRGSRGGARQGRRGSLGGSWWRPVGDLGGVRDQPLDRIVDVGPGWGAGLCSGLVGDRCRILVPAPDAHQAGNPSRQGTTPILASPGGQVKTSSSVSRET